MDEVKEIQVTQVVNALKSRGQTLALAESCTGGLLSSWITRIPGVSEVFKGAVVSYAGEVKQNILGVPEELLKLHGEVSPLVAEKMAQGARRVLLSDWSISITGIAGPTGGSDEKPIGTVCFAVVGPDIEKSYRNNFDPRLSREEIQEQASVFALNLLLEFLKS